MFLGWFAGEQDSEDVRGQLVVVVDRLEHGNAQHGKGTDQVDGCVLEDEFELSQVQFVLRLAIRVEPGCGLPQGRANEVDQLAFLPRVPIASAGGVAVIGVVAMQVFFVAEHVEVQALGAVGVCEVLRVVTHVGLCDRLARADVDSLLAHHVRDVRTIAAQNGHVVAHLVRRSIAAMRCGGGDDSVVCGEVGVVHVQEVRGVG